MIHVTFEDKEIDFIETASLEKRLSMEENIIDFIKKVNLGRSLLKPVVCAMYFLKYYAPEFQIPVIGEGDNARTDLDFCSRLFDYIFYYDENDKPKCFEEFEEIYWAVDSDMKLFESVAANAPTNEMIFRLIGVMDAFEDQVTNIGSSLKKLIDKANKQLNHKNLNKFLKDLEERMVGEIPNYLKSGDEQEENAR